MLQFDTLPPYTPVTDTVCDSNQVVCAYDTIFTPMGRVEPMVRRSLFTHHELQVHSSSETPIYRQQAPGWYLGGIVLSIALIGLFMKLHNLKFTDFLVAVIDNRAMERILRDTNLTHAVSQIPIAPLMLMPMALVAYHAFMPKANTIGLDILNYTLLMLASLLVYFFRNGIFRFMGNAFDNKDAIHLYLSNNYVFHLLYGIVCTAMAFFVIYTNGAGEAFLYVLCGIIGLLSLLRLLKGMQLFLTVAKKPKMHFFCYLCILEIVPIIIVIRLVIIL